MQEIREGFTSNLTAEQVNLYANPKLDVLQMREIQKGFYKGLSIEQVQQYADSKFPCNKMISMRCLLSDGVQDIKLYKHALTHYTKLEIPEEQSKVLAKAASNGISLAKLDVIAKGHFTAEQTEFLLKNMQKNTNTISENVRTSKESQHDHSLTDRDIR